MKNVNNSPITRRNKASDPNVLASSLAESMSLQPSSNFKKCTNIPIVNNDWLMNTVNQANFYQQLVNAGVQGVALSIGINYDTTNSVFVLGQTTNQVPVSNLLTVYNTLLQNNIEVYLKFTIVKRTTTPLDYPTYFSKYKTLLGTFLNQFPNAKYVTIFNENPDITINPTLRSNISDIITYVKSLIPNTKVGFSSLVLDEGIWCTPLYADLVDFFGFNYYPPVTTSGINAFTNDQALNMIPKTETFNFVEWLNNLSIQYNKPYIITEIGITPANGSGSAPSTAITITGSNRNNQNQINYLQSAFEVFSPQPNCNGIWTWNCSYYDTFDWYKDSQLYSNFASLVQGGGIG